MKSEDNLVTLNEIIQQSEELEEIIKESCKGSYDLEISSKEIIDLKNEISYFNKIFSTHGWVNYDSMNEQLLKKS